MTEDLDIVHSFKNISEWYGAGFYACNSALRQDAEIKLGIKFPQAYLDLISALEEQGVASQDIIEAFENSGVPSWPKHLVPFFQDGHGNAYCFDTESMSQDYPVVFWDHELTRDENVARPGETDESFSAWVIRYVRDEIPSEEPRALGKGFGVGCLFAVILVLVLACVCVGALIRWIMNV